MFQLPNTYNWSEVVDPITEEQLVKWIADLRSGEYRQGQNFLYQEKEGICSHCCLGVLAESVGNLEKNTEYDDYMKIGTFNGSTSSLIGEGLDRYYKRPFLPALLQNELYQMNDTQNKSFAEIADYLELTFGLKDA